MSIKSVVLICFVMLLGGLSPAIYSQQMAELQKLSKDADVILTGKVTKQQSAWNQDKSRIITYTTVKANEYIKGNTNNNYVVISHPGGEIDGVGEMYTHMPTFTDDEEVLLFLKNNKDNSDYNVLYGEEGKIAILNSGSGEKVTAFNVPVKMLKSQIQKYVSHQ